MRNGLLAAIAVLSTMGTGWGGEGFSQLPEEGAWAKFYVTVTSNVDLNQTVELTISSTGRVQENGKDCRWVEFVSYDVDTNMRRHLFKMLVPEDELKAG